MTAKNFWIGEAKKEKICCYCYTIIQKGEQHLTIMEGFSPVGIVRFHLSCIEPFIKELREDVKKFVIKQLK